MLLSHTSLRHVSIAYNGVPRPVLACVRFLMQERPPGPGSPLHVFFRSAAPRRCVHTLRLQDTVHAHTGIMNDGLVWCTWVLGGNDRSLTVSSTLARETIDDR